jgi:hypothetical protein
MSEANDKRQGIVRLPLPDGRDVALQLTFAVLDARGHDWFIEQMKAMQKGRATSATARAELIEALSSGAVTAEDMASAPVSDYPLAASMKAIWAAWEIAQYGPDGRSGDEAAANPPKARATLWRRIVGRH